MKKVDSVQEAFELEGLDPSKIEINGVPERHKNALIAMAKLFVVVDQVNPEFKPDYTDRTQPKFEPWFKMGSPAGGGFSYRDYDLWYSLSRVGARLASESPEAGEFIAKHPEFGELYREIMVYERQIK